MGQKIQYGWLLGVGLGLSCTLSGCQSSPQVSSVPNKSSGPAAAAEKKPQVYENDGIKIIPYDRPEIKREKLEVIVPDQKPRPSAPSQDGRNIPAFKSLIQQTQQSFQRGQLEAAEKSAMQAQRLAPQAAETYMYLAMIANQEKQPKNAESLARRGLTYARTTTMQRQLWQIILKSAQLQQNSVLQKEAQSRLQSLAKS